MAYYFYLDKMLLPIAPSKLQLNINNQNKTLTLINEGEINILKKAKLTDIDFDILLPQVKYPFATYKNGFQKVQVYLSELEKLKTSQKPFQFIVTRTLPSGKMLFDTNMKVSMEDYKVKEDTKNGFDLTVTISLKQYKDYGTKKCNITITKTETSTTTTATVEKARAAETSPEPKLNGKTYTVVKNDTLWAISKKFYGDGSKYTKIFDVNSGTIKNANLIYPGQVLTIPV